MHRARHCLSLAAVAALTCGLGGNLPADTAYAESGVSTANRIMAVYRVDIGSFNLGEFSSPRPFRGDDYEMRGEGRFKVLEGLIYRVARGDGQHRPGNRHRARARHVCVQLRRRRQERANSCA